jgi:hypothetical protein
VTPSPLKEEGERKKGNAVVLNPLFIYLFINLVRIC